MSNIREILDAECERGFEEVSMQDQRRLGAIQAIMGILLGHADDMTEVVFRASQLSRPLSKMNQECDKIPEVAKPLAEIVEKFKRLKASGKW